MVTTLILGDYGYNINFALATSGGTALNLTGGTAWFSMGYSGTDTAYVSGTCIIDTAASGLCHYVVKQSDMQDEGNYDYKVRVEYASSQITSVPTDSLIVKRQSP